MRTGWYILIGLGLVGAILTGFLVGFSFEVVRPNELVLVIDNNNLHLYQDESIVDSGTYFVGVSKDLIRFPANLILVDFSFTFNDNATQSASAPSNVTVVNRTLSCWTQDGLDVYIDLNFFYRINRANLLWFFKEFGYDWKDLMEQLARKSIKETAVLYPSSFYYTNRTLLHAAFSAALQASYDAATNRSIQVQYFQIQYINFGSGLESSIVAKLVQQHYYNLYNYQGQINLINANTSVFSNNTYNQINLTLANATAFGLQSKLNLTSQALVNYLQNMTTAYSQIKASLGATWTQMYPLMYAIEMKTSNYLKKNMSYVPKTVQRIIQSM